MRAKIAMAAALGALCALAGAESGAAHIGLELPRGQAEIRVGPGPLAYNPLAGERMQIEVWGRLSRGFGQRIWLRYKAPGSRCARSYARDRGHPLGRKEAPHYGDDTFSVTFEPKRTWKAGTVRFCAWIARSRRARVRPNTENVEFYDRLGGAVVASTGAFHPEPEVGWLAVSTHPFQAKRTVTYAPTPGVFCLQPDEDEWAVDEHSDRVYKLAGYDSPGLSCPATRTFQFRLFGAPVPPDYWNNLQYTDDEIRSSAVLKATRIGPPEGEGKDNACVLGASFTNVQEAVDFVTNVGCVPARVISRPRTPDESTGYPRMGEVYEFEMHGGRAELAKPCSRIDVIVQARRPDVQNLSSEGPPACLADAESPGKDPRQDRSPRCEAVGVSADGQTVRRYDDARALARPRRFDARTALWTSQQGMTCHDVIELLRGVLPAADELVALEAAGWRVSRIERVKLGQRLVGRRIRAQQGAKRVAYVRRGRSPRIDRSVYRAGQQVEFDLSEAACTTAFVLMLRSPARPVGLTTGHCSKYPILGTESETAVHERGKNARDPLGWVLANSNNGGGPDALVFGLDQISWATQQIERGSRAPLRVTGWVPTRGQRRRRAACYRGITSGGGCGRIVDFRPGGADTGICASMKVKPGDSGGPVFTPPNRNGEVRALGIVMGNRLDLHGLFGLRGEMCYQPIESILRTFDADLPTGPLATGGVIARASRPARAPLPAAPRSG